jgi:hypothetical protein
MYIKGMEVTNMSMGITKRPPHFVPKEFCGEMEKISKAALMDMVWTLAGRIAGNTESGTTSFENTAPIVALIREEWEIVKIYRDSQGNQ